MKAAEKAPLQADEITGVQLRARDETAAPVRLSADEIAEFARQWNKARGIGLCKFYPMLWITVYQADGGTREFRMNGRSVKEGNDYCYRMGKSYGEGLRDKLK